MSGNQPNRGKPAPRWHVQPLRKLEGEVGYRCPDERCGESVVQPVMADGTRGKGRDRGKNDRCPTCLTTVVPI